jgi:hypothetical protein
MRPLWLDEILIYRNTEPIPISWPKRPEQKVRCGVLRKFEHVGTQYAPSKDPHVPEFILFDVHTARHLEKQGQIAIWSARVDIGTAKLEKRGVECPAYRPWPGSLPGQAESGEFHPPVRDDPFFAVQLYKHIQIFPGLLEVPILPGDIFVTSYSVIKQLGHSVEDVPGNNFGPLVILQP